MSEGGFGRGINNSLRQNRELLRKEKRSLFNHSSVFLEDQFLEQDDDLSPEEMATLKSRLKHEARKERIQDFLAVIGILFALGIAVTIFLYLAGLI